MTARFLNAEFFEFVPQCKIWMSTNSKPRIEGCDLGIWRRIHLIPFSVTIPPEERDHDMPRKLRDELPGIFQRAIRGALEWSRGGLRPPRAVVEAVAQYRDESDGLGQFIDECCEVPERGTPLFSATKSKSSDLYHTYNAWATANNERPLTQKTFNERLSSRGFLRARNSRGWEWHGVAPTADALTELAGGLRV